MRMKRIANCIKRNFRIIKIEIEKVFKNRLFRIGLNF